ncbi:hypothetical protein ACP70R_030782 [Stipagrostis hirtigluma subsp. patula]
MAPPSSPAWVILATVPRVSAAATAADVSLAVAAPPRVTFLTVSPRVSPADPDPAAGLLFPFVLASDPSGLLLTITPQSASAPPPKDLAYFVLDVPSATASHVDGPDPDWFVFSWEDLGVIAAPGGGYMIAGFNRDSSPDLSLICFSPHIGVWIEKDVDNPEPDKIWSFSDVISHDGKLWWVDTAEGLLVCDPFPDQPVLDFVAFPEEACDESDDEKPGDDQPLRRVRVLLSNGKFRCVKMTWARQGGAPTVAVFTLVDPDTEEWTLEYEVTFADIWADDTYKAAGLPEKTPVIALMHPKNPDVLYFFLGEFLFAVDMRAKKVVECVAHELHGPASEVGVSPSRVLAWELPPALTAVPTDRAKENLCSDIHGIWCEEQGKD